MRLLLLLLFIPWRTYAKPVKIEWEPVPGSIQYELRINGETTDQILVRESQWKADLSPGSYTYELRSIDRFKRPGEWSVPRMLVVMPAAPVSIFPKTGERIVFYDKAAAINIRFRKSEEKSLHLVQVLDGTKVIYETLTESSEVSVADLAPGNYRWRAQPVVKASTRAPASLTGKEWKGESSKAEDFVVEHRSLQAPDLLYPKGVIEQIATDRIELVWSKLDGAEAYEVELEAQGKVESYRAKEASLSVPASIRTPYIWRVRALANLDGENKASAIGPKSESNFLIERRQVQHGKGRLSFSAAYSAYTYEVMTPSLDLKGSSSNSGDALTLRLQGETWLDSPNWSVQGSLARTSVQIQGTRADQWLTGAHAKYNLFVTNSGWALSPKFGAELRHYFQLVPEDPIRPSLNLKKKDFLLLGPSVGLELRKRMSKKWEWGAELTDYLPVASLKTPAGALLKDNSPLHNASFSLEGLRWLSPQSGIALESVIERRGVHFETGSSPVPETSDMTLLSIYLTFVHSW